MNSAPDIKIIRLTDGNTWLLQEIARIQDTIFQRKRQNRLCELKHIMADYEKTALFLAFCGSLIAGFIHIRRMKSRKYVWMIRGIGVTKGCRRRGIGTRLLESAVAFITERKGMELHSCVDRANIASLMLHRQYGFIENSEGIYGISELRVNFILSL